MDITLKEITDRQHAWCEEMGWHNKLPLEYLALIGSEVGEACNEVRGPEPTAHLAEELADIILRTVDFARTLGIDLGVECDLKIKKNVAQGKKPGRIK